MGIAMFGLSGGAMALIALGAYFFVPSVRRAVGGVLRKPAHLALAVLAVLFFTGSLGNLALSSVQGSPDFELKKDASVDIVRVEYSLGASPCGTFQTKTGKPEHLELRCNVSSTSYSANGEARFNATFTRKEASNAATILVWLSTDFFRNESNAADTVQYNLMTYGVDGSYDSTIGSSTTGQALYGTKPYVKSLGFAEGTASVTTEVILQLSSSALGSIIVNNGKDIVLNIGKEPGVAQKTYNINVARSS